MPQPAPPRVLVVDDEARLARNLQVLLAAEGFAADAACGVREALRLLEAGAYRVLLTDLLMPDGGGAALLARVRERFPRTAVVVMTAYDDLAPRPGAEDGFPSPPPRLLLKPFDPAELIRLVREAAQGPAESEE